VVRNYMCSSPPCTKNNKRRVQKRSPAYTSLQRVPSDRHALPVHKLWDGMVCLFSPQRTIASAPYVLASTTSCTFPTRGRCGAKVHPKRVPEGQYRGSWRPFTGQYIIFASRDLPNPIIPDFYIVRCICICREAREGPACS
jgi:hypothetical protein